MNDFGFFLLAIGKFLCMSGTGLGILLVIVYEGFAKKRADEKSSWHSRYRVQVLPRRKISLAHSA